MLKKILQFFQQPSPNPITSKPLTNQKSNPTLISNSQSPIPPIQNPKSKIPNPKTPHWRRIQQVYTVLETAPPNLTYDQLIHHVRETTGRGCSRKLIAKWKKQRATQY